jgi:hypothetical protein
VKRYSVALRIAGVMDVPPRDIRVEAQVPSDVRRPEAYISAGFTDIWPDCKVLSVTEITGPPSEGGRMQTRRPTRQEAARAALALILTVLFDYAVIRRLVRQTGRQFARKWATQLVSAILAGLLTLAIRAIRAIRS